MLLALFTAVAEVVMIKKPNSLCKNINCRKPFYACAYCTHKIAWRSVACCPECFDAYMQQVSDARAANRKVSMLPERTDMTEEQVKELIATPIDAVIDATKEELREYSDDLESIELGETIDKINEEIRESQELDSDSIPLSSDTGRTNRNKKK